MSFEAEPHQILTFAVKIDDLSFLISGFMWFCFGLVSVLFCELQCQTNIGFEKYVLGLFQQNPAHMVFTQLQEATKTPSNL